MNRCEGDKIFAVHQDTSGGIYGGRLSAVNQNISGGIYGGRLLAVNQNISGGIYGGRLLAVNQYISGDNYGGRLLVVNQNKSFYEKISMRILTVWQYFFFFFFFFQQGEQMSVLLKFLGSREYVPSDGLCFRYEENDPQAISGGF